MPFRTEGTNAARRPLVLPHRSCHQASLLVSRRGGRKGCAYCPAEAGSTCDAGRAGSGGRDAAFDRKRPRRTAGAADDRATEPRRYARAGECRGRRGYGGGPDTHHPPPFPLAPPPRPPSPPPPTPPPTPTPAPPPLP